MKTLGWISLLTLLVYAIQTALLPLFSIYGVSADLMLLYTTSVGLLRGKRVGALAGFSFGLLEDLGSGGFFGIHAFFNLLVGYVIGRFSGNVFEDRAFLPVIASVVVTAMNYVVMSIFMALLGYTFHPLMHLHVLIAMLVFQLVFSYPVHYTTRCFDRRIVSKK